jgi:hypothetical protein
MLNTPMCILSSVFVTETKWLLRGNTKFGMRREGGLVRQCLQLLLVAVDVLVAVHDNPSTSMGRIAPRTGIPQSTVWRAPHKSNAAKGERQCLVQLCHRVLRNIVHGPDFLSRVLWADEAGFTKSGTTDIHSLHEWAVDNPRAS